MDDNINFIGKVAKFPKNTKASSAYNHLENIRVSKKKLWYILTEKDDDGLMIVKYNNKLGFNLFDFINELKEHYKKDDNISKYIGEFIIEGKEDFSIIKNVPDVLIGDKKLLTIIMQDLLKLLYK